MDGGLRSGSDVFKALAIGAKAVFVGRPALWGLAVNVSGVAQQRVSRYLSIHKSRPHHQVVQHYYYLCM